MAGFFFPGFTQILEGITGVPIAPIFRPQNPFSLIINGHQERETAEERPRQDAARETNRIRAELSQERQKLEDMRKHMAEMERDALEHERKRKKILARLARQADRAKTLGYNIGVFGLTSTGKSTIINGLIGDRVAAVGVGETTRERKAYKRRNCTYWDTPGRNDESKYTNKEYISFIKGLTRRLIVIRYTVKENLELIRLLDSLGLGYDIIVNKFDDVEEDERSKFQRQILKEIKSCGLQQMKNVFFLSGQYPRMFSDWLKMVNYLTEPCADYDRYTDTESSSSSDDNESSNYY